MTCASARTCPNSPLQTAKEREPHEGTLHLDGHGHRRPWQRHRQEPGRARRPQDRHAQELGGKDDGYNPEQLFAAGYSNCYLGAIKFVAGKEQPPVQIAPDATVTCKATLGARDDGGGFEIGVEMDVHLPGVDKAKAEDIARKAHTVCPYSWSIRNNVNVKTNVV